jgi:hypothetical protein
VVRSLLEKGIWEYVMDLADVQPSGRNLRIKGRTITWGLNQTWCRCAIQDFMDSLHLFGHVYLATSPLSNFFDWSMPVKYFWTFISNSSTKRYHHW